MNSDSFGAGEWAYNDALPVAPAQRYPSPAAAAGWPSPYYTPPAGPAVARPTYAQVVRAPTPPSNPAPFDDEMLWTAQDDLMQDVYDDFAQQEIQLPSTHGETNFSRPSSPPSYAQAASLPFQPTLPTFNFVPTQYERNVRSTPRAILPAPAADVLQHPSYNLSMRRQGPLPVLPDLTRAINTTDSYLTRIGVAGNSVMEWARVPKVLEDRKGLQTGHIVSPGPPVQQLPTPPSTAKLSSSNGKRRTKREIHDGVGDYRCECGAGFEAPEVLRKHISNVHGERKHACCHCSERFLYPNNVQRHIDAVHNDTRGFFCPMDYCKYHTAGFSRRDHLKRHILGKHLPANSAPGM
ncbi:hypothetical protein LTR09_007541 [Extremus antarcticus]|uniref:C2H2-type domain-containing protein n=1 Tax=Extremus antarcticus TaxID=702011 RepID=A0AAJ0GAY0_9PEZI|nr:hypothetical protein LTR09_007541 [Extremus antarcticus]